MNSFFLCMCYRLVDMSTNPYMEMKVGLLKGTVDEAVGRSTLEEEVEEVTSWAPLHSGAGGKTGQWDRRGGVCVCVCVCVCVLCACLMGQLR